MRRRRAAAASQDDYWNKRHQLARQWANRRHLSREPSNRLASEPSIDAFVDAKIARAVAASSTADSQQSEHFHNQVLPVLRENCFRCHGEKDKGGLKLNSREAALRGGIVCVQNVIDAIDGTLDLDFVINKNVLQR